MISKPCPKGNTGVHLADLSSKDKPWDKHRETSDVVEQKLRATTTEVIHFFPDRWAARVAQCSQVLAFTLGEVKCEVKLKLKSANFCRVAVCAVCQWRKMLKNRARFIECLKKLVQVYTDCHWVLLTLTIRNCPIGELRANLKAMVRGWAKLRERQEFPALGYIRALEVTRNPDTGEAHPHYHCLLLVKKSYFSSRYYLSQERWTELWQEAMGLSYTPIVNVKKVRKKRGKKYDPLEGQGEADLDDNIFIEGLLETIKYTVKGSDLINDDDFAIKMADEIFGLKRVVPGGVVRDFLDDEESDSEDLINISEKSPEEEISDSRELLFEWYRSNKSYNLIDINN